MTSRRLAVLQLLERVAEIDRNEPLPFLVRLGTRTAERRLRRELAR